MTSGCYLHFPVHKWMGVQSWFFLPSVCPLEHYFWEIGRCSTRKVFCGKLENYYIPYGPLQESQCICAWKSIRSLVGRKQLTLFNSNIHSFIYQVFIESLQCGRHCVILPGYTVLMELTLWWNDEMYGEKNWCWRTKLTYKFLIVCKKCQERVKQWL